MINMHGGNGVILIFTTKKQNMSFIYLQGTQKQPHALRSLLFLCVTIMSSEQN